MTGKPKRLTHKQELFCREYIVDFNATQAAIRAGYSKGRAEVTGSENVRKRNLAAYIKELSLEVTEKAGITAEYVREVVQDTIERCRAEDGFNPAAIFKGTDQCSRWLGLYEEDNRQRNPAGQRIADLSTEEQELILEKLDAIFGPNIAGNADDGPSSRTTH